MGRHAADDSGAAYHEDVSDPVQLVDDQFKPEFVRLVDHNEKKLIVGRTCWFLLVE